MKATSFDFLASGLKRLTTAAFMAVTVHGAAATEAAGSTTPTAPKLLGGIALHEPAMPVAIAPFQFDRNFDGLVARMEANDGSVPVGVDPMKTAAIIPGVFGSVAIPMRNFPVAGRWANVYREIDGCAEATACGERGAAFAALAENTRDKRFLDKLATVNRAVNTLIAYRKDEATYGNLDYWAKPAEILSLGSGDCEDFAILKMAALIAAGVPAQSMSLVVLQDRSRGVYHAILSVATQSGTFILDNLSNTVTRDKAYRSYVPLYSFSTDRAWIHGAKPGTAQVATATGNFATIAPGEGSMVR
ncbi:transglutaminase-like cysteine peptidase [Aminobacter sp. HY435]|uniref:transglutaminase-like cysteine peptidase n=1 Tax=Aminobacter sp. HY435 TaxID=2970917 RepID=UPI0022B967C9|nr:transglutaminase-like cysteine peptidase [Aminobacter sp. HY435]